MELKLDMPSVPDTPDKRFVSERIAFADDDTHMVHFLKDLIQQKLIMKWCKDNGLDSIQYYALYRYAVGSKARPRVHRRVPLELAFRTRLSVQPAMWYVPYNEPLPAPVAFHPIHEARDLLTQESVAQMLLRERRGTLAHANLTTISRECGVKYAIIRNLINRVSKSNYPEKVWYSSPNAQTVCALSKYVPIDTWFIFPDELDDQHVKDMFFDFPQYENKADEHPADSHINLTLNVSKRRVIDKVVFCDDDTHMMRFIKTLLQRQLLRKWCEENSLNETVHGQLYNYAMAEILVGHRTFCYPPVNVVFKARKSVQPAMWYVPYNEPLPEPVAFHPTHDAADLATEPTVSRLLLMEQRVPSYERSPAGVRNHGGRSHIGLNTIAKDVGIRCSNLYSLVAKPRGDRIIGHFPAVNIMCALSKYIPIDTWFVFPDELDDQKIKNMFRAWPPVWEERGRG